MAIIEAGDIAQALSPRDREADVILQRVLDEWRDFVAVGAELYARGLI